MDIVADAKIPFPRSVVYACYRDKLADLVTYLPNVRSIEVKSRKEEGSIVELVNIWHGGGEIPAAARAILSEAMLSWTDYAKWDESKWTCDWRTETHAFTEAVDCKGTNRFVETSDGGTMLEIRGKIEIDAAKIKGVPRMFAGKVGKTIEEFLGNKIKPNLIDVSEGVKKYLEAHRLQRTDTGRREAAKDLGSFRVDGTRAKGGSHGSARDRQNPTPSRLRAFLCHFSQARAGRTLCTWERRSTIAWRAS